MSGLAVYLAAPMALYDGEAYDRALTLTKQRFARSRVVSAREEYKSSVDWFRRWPDVLRSLSALVFLADTGWLGYCGYAELRDARDLGLPTFYLHDGQFRRRFKVQAHGLSMRQWALVTAPKRKAQPALGAAGEKR